MSANYLSFEDFTETARLVATIKPIRGIVHRDPDGIERRFNNRFLQRSCNHFCEVQYFIDEDGVCGPCAIIFDVDGRYVGQADEKRPYYPEYCAFQDALDLDPVALRQLYRNGPIGWHGKPWHTLLAEVLWDVITEFPPKGLPWNGAAQ
jgi:hypothetical protein